MNNSRFDRKTPRNKINPQKPAPSESAKLNKLGLFTEREENL
jgi:hypothetical protein